MSDVGVKVAAAYEHGEFECGICEKFIGLDDPADLDEARDQILEHHHTEHDEEAADE